MSVRRIAAKERKDKEIDKNIANESLSSLRSMRQNSPMPERMAAENTKSAEGKNMDPLPSDSLRSMRLNPPKAERIAAENTKSSKKEGMDVFSSDSMRSLRLNFFV